MKTVFGLIFSFSVIALADTTPAPWDAMLGKYSVPADCAFDSNNGFKKLIVEKTADGKMLQLTAFSSQNKGDDTIAIGNFEKNPVGTDGTVTYTVSEVTEKSFASTEHFVRVGSETWEDMERKIIYRLELHEQDLFVTRITQVNQRTPNASSCHLKSLSHNSDEINWSAVPLKNKALSDLSALTKAVINAKPDIDQAAFQLTELQLNIKEPTFAQLKEVLTMSALPTVSSMVSFRNIGVATDAEQMAITALGSALENAKDPKEISKLTVAIEKILKANKTTIKAILVHWVESDAKGAGILLLDIRNGQILYIGSGYFS